MAEGDILAILSKADTAAVILVLGWGISALLTGKFVPGRLHERLVDLIVKDRDEWKAHSEGLREAIERLTDKLELKPPSSEPPRRRG